MKKDVASFTTEVTVSEFCEIAATDSEAIRMAVNAAMERGLHRVRIPSFNPRTGNEIYEIESAILLPSDFEILLDNCTLRQADGIFDNVFRTENTYKEETATQATRQRNIHIRGEGHAVIDGGNHNGLTERTSLRDGRPHIMANNMILLTNVEDFSITGITFREMRWWAIDLIFAARGLLSDLTFLASDRVPNQDGIDLRVGCRRITIQNIYGLSGDDLIALSGFCGFEKRYGLWVEGLSPDIAYVSIRNVIGSSVTKAVVALRNHDGIKLHDVDIDGVMDTSEDGKSTPYAIVRIGQKTYGSIGFSTLSDTSRISVRNIHAYCGDAIMINVTLENSVFENIFLGGQARSALTTRSDWKAPGATMRGVTVRGVYCSSVGDAPLFDLIREEGEFMESVRLCEVVAPSGRLLLNSQFPSGISTDF